MNFIYVIHLMCWNYLIALIDLITHSRNRNNRNSSIHCNNKRGRARSACAPLLFPPPLLFLLSCLTKILTQNLTQIFTKHLAKILTKPWAKSGEKFGHFFLTFF